MRYLKMIGLAAVAAAVLMAVAGAGAASATELCSTNATPCPSPYGSGTSLKASLKTGTSAVLSNSLATITCTGSEVAGSTTSAGGSGATPVPATIANLALTKCANGFGSACTFTSANTPYTASITGSGASSNLKVIGVAWKVVCGSMINCTFTSKEANLPTNGSVSPATISANKVRLEPSGGFCPESATWTATYVVSSPSPMFVV